MKVILFIPCYNVASKVTQVLDALSPEILQRFWAIYLIDNGSSDGTREILQRYAKARPEFTLFFNERNYSLGGSTIIAFREAIRAGADFVICMHSDGQADPKDLAKFFPLSQDEDFVFGSRMLGASRTSDYSLLRKAGNYFFALLQQLILRQRIFDIGAFVAFNLKTIRSIPFERIPADMSYHPTLVLYLARQKRLRLREFPIYWGPVHGTEVNIWAYGTKHLTKLLAMALGLYRLSNQKLVDFQTKTP